MSHIPLVFCLCARRWATIWAQGTPTRNATAHPQSTVCSAGAVIYLWIYDVAVLQRAVYVNHNHYRCINFYAGDYTDVMGGGTQNMKADDLQAGYKHAFGCECAASWKMLMFTSSNTSCLLMLNAIIVLFLSIICCCCACRDREPKCANSGRGSGLLSAVQAGSYGQGQHPRCNAGVPALRVLARRSRRSAATVIP